MPSRPSAPRSGASSRGEVPDSNHSAIRGRTLSRTKDRTVCWMRRSSSDSRLSKSIRSRSLPGTVSPRRADWAAPSSAPGHNPSMAYDEELAERLRELVAAEPGQTEQRMFGGLAFLINGNLAVAASGQGGLLVRVDPDQGTALADGELVAP